MAQSRQSEDGGLGGGDSGPVDLFVQQIEVIEVGRVGEGALEGAELAFTLFERVERANEGENKRLQWKSVGRSRCKAHPRWGMMFTDFDEEPPSAEMRPYKAPSLAVPSTGTMDTFFQLVLNVEQGGPGGEGAAGKGHSVGVAQFPLRQVVQARSRRARIPLKTASRAGGRRNSLSSDGGISVGYLTVCTQPPSVTRKGTAALRARAGQLTFDQLLRAEGIEQEGRKYQGGRPAAFDGADAESSPLPGQGPSVPRLKARRASIAGGELMGGAGGGGDSRRGSLTGGGAGGAGGARGRRMSLAGGGVPGAESRRGSVSAGAGAVLPHMQRRASVTGTLTPDERRELDKKVKAQSAGAGAEKGGSGGSGGGVSGGGGGGGQVGMAAGARGSSRSRARRNSLATLDLGGGGDSPGVTTFNRAGRRNSVAGGSLALPKSAF